MMMMILNNLISIFHILERSKKSFSQRWAIKMPTQRNLVIECNKIVIIIIITIVMSSLYGDVFNNLE